jgi:hypothetical protein
MKKKILFTLLTALFFSTTVHAQNKYACFKSEADTSLQLSVYFDKHKKAKFVRYKGQPGSIALVYSGIEKDKNENPGGIPAIFWAATYLERYNGKITGTYVFTNAGTYGLDVTYTRKKDKKEFYFSILENRKGEDGSIWCSAPCF